MLIEIKFLIFNSLIIHREMIRRKLSVISGFLALSVITLIQVSCKSGTPSDLSGEHIIPVPVSVVATGDYFRLDEKTAICISDGSDELRQLAEYLAERLRPATGFAFAVKTTKVPPKGSIYLTFAGADSIPLEEGYTVTITKKLLTLAAKSPAGIFRGIQTIRQLLPSGIELSSVQQGEWKIATGTIVDYPVYGYRSTMLDVARHFFGVEDVKRVIDLASAYKINALHLHLSDDQGWRIEIKSWPNLTLYGGSTKVGGGDGGYFTQEQYSEIVRYADSRYITIVPEIDMPGHTNAALASYAELNCNGRATKLYTGTVVGFSTLCTGKEITYRFVDDVVREISALTTGPYFHIGGDESHATKKEDYIPFVERVQDIVLSHNKKSLGWDEISLGLLRPGTVAQYWSSAENAKRAVSQGAKLLMSPSSKAYIDMKYDSTTAIGYTWAGYIEIDKAYNWDPATLVPGIVRDNIFGVESPLWTETITNIREIEFMIFPRLPAIAEIGWSPARLRNWDDFKVRLGNHGKRFEAMGINYYKSALVPWAD